MKTFYRCVARVLTVCMLGLGLPMPASAGIVTTAQSYGSAERNQVKAYLERADVRARMQALGVDPQAARARVDVLSDDEVAQLASKIDSAPAGGDGVLEVALIVFLVLLATDILGYTKVFPFTRSIR